MTKEYTTRHRNAPEPNPPRCNPGAFSVAAKRRKGEYMKLNAVTTLTGTPIMEAFRGLDQELSPFAEAYKAITGGAGAAAGLTDITPGFLVEVLLETFGPLGIGWAYEVETLDSSCETRERSKGGSRDVWIANARVNFWYAYLTSGSDEPKRSVLIPGAGGSENERREWAEKGAVTNALGMVVSHMGYQVSVYKGLRSHQGGNGTRRTPPRQQQSSARPPAGPPAAASPYQCPSCNAPVEDNRARHQENHKSPAWRCTNQSCTGGSNDRPWASWSSSEFESENPPTPPATPSPASPSPTTSSQPSSAKPKNGNGNGSQVTDKDRNAQADAIAKAAEHGIDEGSLDVFCRNNILRRPLDLMSGGALVALIKKLEPAGGEVSSWLREHRAQ